MREATASDGTLEPTMYSVGPITHSLVTVGSTVLDIDKAKSHVHSESSTSGARLQSSRKMDGAVVGSSKSRSIATRPVSNPESSRRASINSLSHEIVLMILKYFTITREDNAIERCLKRRSLAALARVSRAFTWVATDMLYQWVELYSYNQCKKLIKTLHRKPAYGKLVKVLVFPDGWTSRSSVSQRRRTQLASNDMAQVATILQKCPYLDSMRMATTKEGPFLILSPNADTTSDDPPITVMPFSRLVTLRLSHLPFYDFSVRSPLPSYINFAKLENLSLHRFVIWRDDFAPMQWPDLPCLRTLTLEECFLHGEELSSLLISVRNTIRAVHLIRSIFSISIISNGLERVADVIEELFISEHWGFDDVPAVFDKFTSLRTLRIEPANWSLNVYTHLPPKLQTLSIWASEDSFAGWRVLEDILSFLQTDIRMTLPDLKSLEIKAESSQFAPWVEHIQTLCDGHGLKLRIELTDTHPFSSSHPRRRSTLRRNAAVAWKYIKRMGHVMTHLT